MVQRSNHNTSDVGPFEVTGKSGTRRSTYRRRKDLRGPGRRTLSLDSGPTKEEENVLVEEEIRNYKGRDL